MWETELNFEAHQYGQNANCNCGYYSDSNTPVIKKSKCKVGLQDNRINVYNISTTLDTHTKPSVLSSEKDHLACQQSLKIFSSFVFGLVTPLRQRRTSNKTTVPLSLDKQKTSLFAHSLVSRGPWLWNLLPLQMLQITDQQSAINLP